MYIYISSKMCIFGQKAKTLFQYEFKEVAVINAKY